VIDKSGFHYSFSYCYF